MTDAKRIKQYLALIKTGINNAQIQSEELNQQKIQLYNQISLENKEAILTILKKQIKLYNRIQRGINAFFNIIVEREKEFSTMLPKEADMWPRLCTIAAEMRGHIAKLIESTTKQQDIINSITDENLQEQINALKKEYNSELSTIAMIQDYMDSLPRRYKGSMLQTVIVNFLLAITGAMIAMAIRAEFSDVQTYIMEHPNEFAIWTGILSAVGFWITKKD